MYDIVIIMNSFLEYIRQRSVSTLLVSYSVFWAVCHWEGIYASVFTGQEYIMEKYGMLKNEYVHEYFFGINWDNPWPWLAGLVIPAILACLYVWVLPKYVFNPSYKREIGFRVDRQAMKINEERRLISVEMEKTEEMSESIAAEIELEKSKIEASKVNPELKWRDEYREFAGDDTTSAFAILDNLMTVIYTHDGRLSDGYGNRFISEDALMMCDAYGLSNFDSNSRSRIYLTDKGKYFLRQFAKDRK